MQTPTPQTPKNTIVKKSRAQSSASVHQRPSSLDADPFSDDIYNLGTLSGTFESDETTYIDECEVSASVNNLMASVYADRGPSTSEEVKAVTRPTTYAAQEHSRVEHQQEVNDIEFVLKPSRTVKSASSAYTRLSVRVKSQDYTRHVPASLVRMAVGDPVVHYPVTDAPPALFAVTVGSREITPPMSIRVLIEELQVRFASPFEDLYAGPVCSWLRSGTELRDGLISAPQVPSTPLLAQWTPSKESYATLVKRIVDATSKFPSIARIADKLLKTGLEGIIIDSSLDMIFQQAREQACSFVELVCLVYDRIKDTREFKTGEWSEIVSWMTTSYSFPRSERDLESVFEKIVRAHRVIYGADPPPITVIMKLKDAAKFVSWRSKWAPGVRNATSSSITALWATLRDLYRDLYIFVQYDQPAQVMLNDGSANRSHDRSTAMDPASTNHRKHEHQERGKHHHNNSHNMRYQDKQSREQQSQTNAHQPTSGSTTTSSGSTTTSSGLSDKDKPVNKDTAQSSNQRAAAENVCYHCEKHKLPADHNYRNCKISQGARFKSHCKRLKADDATGWDQVQRQPYQSYCSWVGHRSIKALSKAGINALVAEVNSASTTGEGKSSHRFSDNTSTVTPYELASVSSSSSSQSSPVSTSSRHTRVSLPSTTSSSNNGELTNVLPQRKRLINGGRRDYQAPQCPDIDLDDQGPDPSLVDDGAACNTISLWLPPAIAIETLLADLGYSTSARRKSSRGRQRK